MKKRLSILLVKNKGSITFSGVRSKMGSTIEWGLKLKKSGKSCRINRHEKPDFYMRKNKEKNLKNTKS